VPPRDDTKQRPAGDPEHRHGTSLQIRSSFLPEDAMRRIIDEWLVPRLVEEFIRSCNSHRESDNGDQQT